MRAEFETAEDVPEVSMRFAGASRWSAAGLFLVGRKGPLAGGGCNAVPRLGDIIRTRALGTDWTAVKIKGVIQGYRNDRDQE